MQKRNLGVVWLSNKQLLRLSEYNNRNMKCTYCVAPYIRYTYLYLMKKYQSVFLSGFLHRHWLFPGLSNSNHQINKFFERSEKVIYKKIT